MWFRVGETVTLMLYDKRRPAVVLAINWARGTAVVAIGTTMEAHDPRDNRTCVKAGSVDARQMSLHHTTCFRSSKIVLCQLDALSKVLSVSNCPRPLFAQLCAMMPRAVVGVVRTPGVDSRLPPPELGGPR